MAKVRFISNVDAVGVK